MRKLLLGSIICLLSFASLPLAYADIEVSPILIDVVGNKTNAQDIRVTNNGDEIAYVKITPKLITNPGTAQEKLLTIDDPSKLGLLVSPHIMRIAPHKFKLIRLVFTQKADLTDRMYRVDVQPTAGDLLLPNKGSELGIKILVGYGVVIIQRPEKINVKIDATRTQNTLTIKNAGNTNVLLTDGQQCDSKGKQCQELPTKRIYAGQTWEQTLPYTTQVTYRSNYLNNSDIIKSK
jgi:P pilus assembly chaperone PapD